MVQWVVASGRGRDEKRCYTCRWWSVETGKGRCKNPVNTGLVSRDDGMEINRTGPMGGCVHWHKQDKA